MSRKYSTLAKLTRNNFVEIQTEYPEIIPVMKEGIYKYNDKMKNFLIKTIERVEYFRDIGLDALHDILYSLEAKRYEAGTILQKPGEDKDILYFIQDGVVEVYTSFEEDHNFILERLYGGSVINYRLFFMTDESSVYMRFSVPTVLLELPI